MCFCFHCSGFQNVPDYWSVPSVDVVGHFLKMRCAGSIPTPMRCESTLASSVRVRCMPKAASQFDFVPERAKERDIYTSICSFTYVLLYKGKFNLGPTSDQKSP